MNEKKSLLCESILYDGADGVKMLSVHCIFLIKFYIIRNQCVRRTRQFCQKMTYFETNILKNINLHVYSL